MVIMTLCLLWRLFAILLAVAFFSASMSQVMPAVAVPTGMDMRTDMAMIAHDGNPDSAPMPCKGMNRACMTDLGCIFMIGVTVPNPQLVVHRAWFPVSYHWTTNEMTDGSIRAPDLRPPIRLI